MSAQASASWMACRGGARPGNIFFVRHYNQNPSRRTNLLMLLLPLRSSQISDERESTCIVRINLERVLSSVLRFPQSELEA